MPRSLRALALGAALVLAFPAALLANMADPHRPGDAIGEPAAALAGIAVAHESLRVDLSASPATVEAVYTLRNDSTAREVALEFLALGLHRVYDGGTGDGRLAPGEQAYSVTVDGRPLAPAPTDSLRVPAIWSADEVRTPRLDGGVTYYDSHVPLAYGSGETSFAPGFRFTLPVPEGRSTVRVRYPVTLASVEDAGHPRPLRQFAYSLAPARRWAGFGRLDVEVRLPPGVDAASAPGLTREGDVMTGSFRSIPADVLAVAFRERAPLAFHLAAGAVWPWLALCLVVAPLAMGVRAAAGAQRRPGARRQRPRVAGSLGRGVLAAVVAAVGWAALVTAAASLATTPWGYGFAFVAFFLGLPLGIGAVVAYAALEQLGARVLAPALERRRAA